MKHSRIAIISGSTRQNSGSSKFAQLFGRILNRHDCPEVDFVDLAKANLPFWTEEFYEGKGLGWEHWQPISETLQRADGFVLVVPEWSGGAPPAITNFFLFCTENQLAHKPVVLVGVSTSAGGTYPILQLRMSAGKNTKAVFIPDHVIVRGLDEQLKDAEAAVPSTLMKRMDVAAKALMVYTRALLEVRTELRYITKEFPYGM